MGKICPSMEEASPMNEIKQKAKLTDEEIKKASQMTPEEYGSYWWLNILRRNAQAQLDKCWETWHSDAISYLEGYQDGKRDLIKKAEKWIADEFTRHKNYTAFAYCDDLVKALKELEANNE